MRAGMKKSARTALLSYRCFDKQYGVEAALFADRHMIHIINFHDTDIDCFQ